MFKILKVLGDSLTPEYREGDFVVIIKIPFFLYSLKVDDIVAFRHPDYGVLIKKIATISPGGDEIFVVGTHERSVDSRHFGTLRRSDLMGKVIWHIHKPGEGR
jgi:phage repressor protein C with HTH and peptisase S24 domain